MKWIKIIPNDPLFFGSGKPFTAGSDTYANTIFPPHPSTIYGALGTFLIYYRGDLESFKERKRNNQIKPIKLIGPLIYKEEKVYFPAPLDLVMYKEGDNTKISQLNLTKRPEVFISDQDNLRYIHIYKGNEKVDEAKGYLTELYFKRYLMDSLSKDDPLIEPHEFYKEEMKIGIARDKKTMTTKEGYLYRLPMVRMSKDTGFLIGIKIDENEDFPDSGIIQLGGEGRTARFEVLKDNPLKVIENLEISFNGKFKIYLATPAIFKKGWLPEWINERDLTGEKGGIKVKLIGAVIGKYIRISGWDLYNGKPKKSYRAVPPGSVYYFEVQNIDEVDINKIKDVFHLKTISDNLQEEENIDRKGFGLCFVGGVL